VEWVPFSHEEPKADETGLKACIDDLAGSTRTSVRRRVHAAVTFGSDSTLSPVIVRCGDGLELDGGDLAGGDQTAGI
jgi:hypothetical protein